MKDINHYLKLWGLTPDGELMTTRSSRLIPVRLGSLPAMLKIADNDRERFGHRLMVWWEGQGAAKTLAQEGPAILLERAMGPGSLTHMAKNGHDDEATKILCQTIERLHARQAPRPEELIRLQDGFDSLFLAHQRYGAPFSISTRHALDLLHSAEPAVVLHGDIHHDNVLDFGERGWLAIDPKGLYGERGFDYANLFCNPSHETTLAPGRLQQRLDIVLQCTSLERQRLLRWISAWAGLSAAWFDEDGASQNCRDALLIAERASSLIDQR